MHVDTGSHTALCYHEYNPNTIALNLVNTKITKLVKLEGVNTSMPKNKSKVVNPITRVVSQYVNTVHTLLFRAVIRTGLIN